MTVVCGEEPALGEAANVAVEVGGSSKEFPRNSPRAGDGDQARVCLRRRPHVETAGRMMILRGVCIFGKVMAGVSGDGMTKKTPDGLPRGRVLLLRLAPERPPVFPTLFSERRKGQFFDRGQTAKAGRGDDESAPVTPPCGEVGAAPGWGWYEALDEKAG